MASLDSEIPRFLQEWTFSLEQPPVHFYIITFNFFFVIYCIIHLDQVLECRAGE